MITWSTETSAINEITETIKKYGDDASFWRFVNNFAATVSFADETSTEEQRASLLRECSRQFEYLRTEHLKDYSGFFAYGTTYYQDCRVEPGEIVANYVPSVANDVEPSITTSSL